MDTSSIGRLGARAFASAKAAPSQGQLLSELLIAMAAAVPATGTKKFSAKEIGEVLKLAGDDLKRFMPLVVEASLTSAGAVTLVLRDEFRFRPTPEARDLVIRIAFRGVIAPGKLTIDEGLAAVVGFVKTNIKRIEEAAEEGVRGVRVVAGLGTEFYPI